ncbi:hypothetical protein SXCC_00753 [Gluconacetobacter sp. SXCC-1]|nr:hypothetical protein SXCC_00753 [Gluconacetobacter sp. SXCC-1]
MSSRQEGVDHKNLGSFLWIVTDFTVYGGFQLERFHNAMFMTKYFFLFLQEL